MIHIEPGGDGAIYTVNGTKVGSTRGTTCLIQKCTDLPGEQILAFEPNGRITLWADRDAVDSSMLTERVNHPCYATWARLMATGSNLAILGGL